MGNWCRYNTGSGLDGLLRRPAYTIVTNLKFHARPRISSLLTTGTRVQVLRCPRFADRRLHISSAAEEDLCYDTVFRRFRCPNSLSHQRMKEGCNGLIDWIKLWRPMSQSLSQYAPQESLHVITAGSHFFDLLLGPLELDPSSPLRTPQFVPHSELL